MVGLRRGDLHQIVDLAGNVDLPRQRQTDALLGRGEDRSGETAEAGMRTLPPTSTTKRTKRIAWSRSSSPDRRTPAPAREVLCREVTGDRDVLYGCGQLFADLIGQGGDDFSLANMVFS